MSDYLCILLCPVICRYSDSTIEALEMLDNDDKIDLELILALIRHIVLNEEGGSASCVLCQGSCLQVATFFVSEIRFLILSHEITRTHKH